MQLHAQMPEIRGPFSISISMNNTIVHFYPDLFRDNHSIIYLNFSHIGHRKRLYFGVDLDTVNQVLNLSQTLCWPAYRYRLKLATKSCDRAQVYVHKHDKCIILFATFTVSVHIVTPAKAKFEWELE